ncbi:MAG: DUF4980 domain-containing protein, partial [Prevotella sp.]|nr:DUF4980 domain-containing protein [Prevotella sp.]
MASTASVTVAKPASSATVPSGSVAVSNCVPQGKPAVTKGGLLRLADNHVMLRVGNTQSKYVLLPVQEAEEIAAIAVIDGSNNTVQRMNVKLAVDRVDYWVPYELKNAQLLDIVFHGDRRLKGAIADFVCWKEMKLSDSFDTTNTEKYRPMYHHTPQYGWMNDPNGMFYKDGVWHLYYQFNPYGSQWENMTWGHS